jgi:hypothetical protein
MSEPPKDPIGYSGRRWPQYIDEVHEFIRQLQAAGVRSYLEIGCRYGDTVHAVGMALPAGSRIVACDLPDAKNGKSNVGRHPDSATYLHRAVQNLIEEGRDGQVVLGNSQDPAIIAAVKALGPFDAILIDGDHTPAGARADWKNYSPMARKITALHDIFGESSAAKGPKPLFAELRERHHGVAIAHDGLRRGFGLLFMEPALA